MSQKKEDKLAKLEQARSVEIVKSNDLIAARHGLSVTEQKIILYLISKIQKEDKEFQWYDFRISEFCMIIGIDTGGANYRKLKKTIMDLRNRSWWQQLPDGRLVTMSWVDKAMIEPHKGTIRIRLDDDLKPYLLQLQNNFTKYYFINCLSLKSKHSLRLYEYVSMIHYHSLEPYIKQLSLAELYDLFGIEPDQSSYANWKDFKRRVLDPAVTEVSYKSNKTVTYETVHTGRKIVAVRFLITEKDSIETLKINAEANKELNGCLGLSS